MNCGDIGTLRAYFDGELTEADDRQVRQHLDACIRCRAQLDEIRQVSLMVQNAISSLEALQTVDQPAKAHALAQARGVLAARHSATYSASTDLIVPIAGRFSMITKKLSFRPYRVAIAGIAAVVILALVGLTPQGQVATANFLSQFRAQKLKPVTVDPREIGQAMTELAHFGDLDTSMVKRTLSPAASVADATKQAGLTVKQPQSLPSGIPSEPSGISVSQPSTLNFTFRVAKAQSYLTSIGVNDFSIPSKFDGASLTAHVPPVVMMVYGKNGALPNGSAKDGSAGPASASDPTMLMSAMMVIEAGVPSADINGNVSAAELRDLLLRLPGLSPSTVAQLQAIDDWTNTLPIPLPKDQSVWHEVDVNGAKALAVGDNTGVGGFVIWQQGGQVYGVGGPFAEDQLLTVARSIK